MSCLQLYNIVFYFHILNRNVWKDTAAPPNQLEIEKSSE